jgi:hypothetical protein
VESIINLLIVSEQTRTAEAQAPAASTPTEPAETSSTPVKSEEPTSEV